MTPDPISFVLITTVIILGTYLGEKEDRRQEYFAYGGKSVSELEKILQASGGNWMSLENIHNLRSWKFFGEREMEEYLKITQNDCDALVRDGVFQEDGRKGKRHYRCVVLPQ